MTLMLHRYDFSGVYTVPSMPIALLGYVVLHDSPYKFVIRRHRVWENGRGQCGSEGAAARYDSPMRNLPIALYMGHVTRMYRTGENRVIMNYSLFYYRADSVAPSVRLPNQSSVNIYLKRPSPYKITKARRVVCMNAPKYAHAASKHFHIL